MEENKIRVESGDGLTQYMAAADETQRELLAEGNPFIEVLRKYDSFFRQDMWMHAPPTASIASILYLNAYQMFLGGVRMALSGHQVALFPLMRTAMESASYGLLIQQQPVLGDVWSNRHKGDAERQACRTAFTFDKAIKGLEKKAPDIHRMAKEAYEGAIDYGAHPNLKGVFGHVSIDNTRADGFIAVTHTSLYGADHHETIRGLCACLDYGFLIISIVTLASPTLTEKLKLDLHSLNDAKEAVVAEYQSDE